MCFQIVHSCFFGACALKAIYFISQKLECSECTLWVQICCQILGPDRLLSLEVTAKMLAKATSD